MNEKKYNFFVESFKKLDIFLALIVGGLIAFGSFVVFDLGATKYFFASEDVINAVNILFICLLGLLGFVFLVLIFPRLFKDRLVNSDFALWIWNFTSIISLAISLVYYNLELKTTTLVWIVLTALGVVFTLVRLIKTKHENNDICNKKYFSLLLKKYNIVYLFLAGAIIGTVLLALVLRLDIMATISDVFPEFAKLTNGQKVSYFVMPLGALVGIIALLTIFVKKFRKVNFVDALLLLSLIALMTFSCYFAVHQKDYSRAYLGLLIIAITGVILLMTLRLSLVTSSTVDTNNPIRVYYSKVGENYSYPFAVTVGGLIALGATAIDYLGFSKINASVRNVTIFYATLALVLIVGIGLFISLITRAFKNKEINFVDGLLMISTSTGVFFVFDLVRELAIYKVATWAVLFVIILLLDYSRIYVVSKATALEDIPFVNVNEEHETFDEIAAKVKEEETLNPEPQLTFEENVENEIVEESPVVTPVFMANDVRPIIKRTYINKLKFTSYRVKDFYSQIKNTLLQYGVINRITNKNETFRKSGLVAKLSVAGKTLRIHLPLNPDDPKYDVNRYHHFSLGDRNAYKDVPFTMKLRSPLAVKRAIELLVDICENDKKLKVRKDFEAVNYVPLLDVDGPAIFEKLGITDKLVPNCDLSYAEQFGKDGLPSLNKICSLMQVTNLKDGLNHESGEEATVYVETVLKYVDNYEISIDTLKDVNQISTKVERLIVKMHEGLDHPISVLCDDIDNEAALVILATGGKVLLYRPKEYELGEDEKTSLPLDEEKEEGEDDDDDSEVTEVTSLNIKSSTFENKLHFLSGKAKGYYNGLKNELLKHGVNNRVVRKAEVFRKSGLVAKITISGKTLRLHLALDPADVATFPVEKYHQFSLADRKSFVEVPFTVKVKSDLAYRRCLELIDTVCENRQLNEKNKYEESDFSASLRADGYAIFEKLGIKDKIVSSCTVNYAREFRTADLPTIDEIVKLIPVEKVEFEANVESSTVYLDTIADKIKGNVVSLETLKEENIIPLATNYLIVKVHEVVDRKFEVYCNEIDDNCAFMVLATGGYVVKRISK